MDYSKPHYDILDGLRGVAALAVLCYHLFEAIAFAAGRPEQDMFHGFMAVDFFFILSGFVMGYAYDDRWKTSYKSLQGRTTDGKDADTFTLDSFIRRRLIRLHPMVVMGAVLGLVAFCMQGCTRWDGSEVSVGTLLVAFLLALFLLPVPSQLDVRGNTELFPLNGPHWSLFFEYIGSLLYALLLRRMPTRWLRVWVVVAGVLLLLNALWQGEGMIAYGWSSQPLNMLGGLLRLTFGYPAGLLLARLATHRPQHAGRSGWVFLACSLILVALLAVPNLGALSLYYQVLCVTCLFPAIVWVGSRAVLAGSVQRVASFLGRLSYPLYAIHYPLIYLYIHWINTDAHPFGAGAWNTPLALSLIAIVLATLIMLCYDEPLRRKLMVQLKKTQTNHA
nr:acyltransferase [Bacteroidaceae bacterium]